MHPITMMKPSSSFALLLALGFTAAGCSGATPAAGGGGGDDTGGDDGGGDDGGDDVPQPLAIDGTYQLTSTYDLATNMPGTVGTVVNELISATDDPDDPTAYIVDKLIAALPDGTIKDYAQQYSGFVTGYLNDRLEEVAPQFVDTIIQVGDKFGQVAKGFGLLETLAIDTSGNAVITVTGVHFKIDNIDLEYAFSDYGLNDVTVDGVNASIDTTGKLTISNHALALQYGQMLHLAMDEAIIPLIDPSAANLSDLLHDEVDCQSVGEYVYDALDFGSASTYETACTAGLSAMATLVYSEIDHINSSALTFTESGLAKGLDKDHDGKMDAIQTGKWDGTLTYATSDAPMATATFIGTRQ
ncbi:MAG TPA: hypothetical protein VGM88_06345 [Kofleriaceae bacterium]